MPSEHLNRKSTRLKGQRGYSNVKCFFTRNEDEKEMRKIIVRSTTCFCYKGKEQNLLNGQSLKAKNNMNYFSNLPNLKTILILAVSMFYFNT